MQQIMRIEFSRFKSASLYVIGEGVRQGERVEFQATVHPLLLDDLGNRVSLVHADLTSPKKVDGELVAYYNADSIIHNFNLGSYLK
jgi:hypothetical protein